MKNKFAKLLFLSLLLYAASLENIAQAQDVLLTDEDSPLVEETANAAEYHQHNSQRQMEDSEKTDYFSIIQQALKTVGNSNKMNNLRENFIDYLEYFEHLSDPKKLLSIDQLALSSNRTQCENDTLEIFMALKNEESWAFTYVDAIGKPPPGLMYGALTWTGAYRQCLSAQSKSSSRTFGGQYCDANMHIPINNPLLNTGAGALLKIGVCIPDSCSNKDFQKILDEGVKTINNFLSSENTSISADSQCHPKYGSVTYTTGAILMIFILSLFVVVMLIGTVLDLYYNTDCFQFTDSSTLTKHSSISALIREDQENYNINHDDQDEPNGGPASSPILEYKKVPVEDLNLLIRILICFSVYKNFNKLFHVEEPKANSQTLHCVHGIRFLSLAWVILGHTFVFTLPASNNSVTSINYAMNHWTFDVIINGTLSVDSFFVLSGLLTAYLFYKALDKNGGAFTNAKFWGLFYFHRYWRLTPPYMLCLGVYYTLMWYMWQGPMWPSEQTRFDPSCGTNAWTNLLYVNNIVNSKEMCMGWSWYLANDMQFYVISPLLMVPLYYSLAGGSILHMAFLLASMIATGVISVNKNLQASIYAMLGEGFDAVYVKPWTRLGPYVIGLLLGYALYRMKTQRRMHWAIVLTGWILSFGLSFTVLYSTYDVIRMKTILDIHTAALYNATCRVAWALSLAWVIFACCNGYGGIINRILSWKVFVPLSRLTYCAYLVHPALMYAFIYSREMPEYLNNSVSILLYLGFTLASYSLAFIASMMFEAPMLELEKIFIRK